MTHPDLQDIFRDNALRLLAPHLDVATTQRAPAAGQQAGFHRG